MSDVQPLGAKGHVRKTKGHASTKNADVLNSETRDWTIKSLSPETVEVSREAAKRSGMKINAWVGKALTVAAVSGQDAASSGKNAQEIVNLEHSILKEIAELKAQNQMLTQTVNGISSMLIKMYTK